jgi:hypothetical protein
MPGGGVLTLGHPCFLGRLGYDFLHTFFGPTRAPTIPPIPFTYTEPAPGINTVHDVMLYASRTHGSKQAFANRDIEKIISEEKEVTKVVGGKEEKQKKTWNYFKLKPFDWMTYEQALTRVREIGSGLRKLGAASEGETYFNIYASTSYVFDIYLVVVLMTAGESAEIGCSWLKPPHSMLSQSVQPMTP